ncbi:Phosphatidate cytidylyltransferase [Roseovarius litorisediminis]|uniref:Phosphatidate cytidylyltransferase n=1 Tax=Roseovarius litorisediminis TaxID=1312363 RepID=A0A1Y5RD00_9RHOB|nr:phosphatidate cytidylyltransferase [Roseovarius litorisediminis]SLN12072.1 Phosphatidate cytidylyltransferase [Roseovarius litorisediminis]
MSDPAQWSDLAPRVLSGIAMAVFGVGIVYAGGWVFSAAVWGLCGLLIWETARMFGATKAVGIAVFGSAALAVSAFSPALLVLPVLLAVAIVGSGMVARDRPLFLVTIAWILCSCYAMIVLRTQFGLTWVLWLIAIVVASDIAGYFAGRLLGGPKFWPQVSPKKTWSGTIAGWIGAALVGLAFMSPLQAGFALVPVSMIIGFAGQMGDIAESAVKRRTGIKDSSNLIPGHGGVFDRLDAMLGAAVLVIALAALQMLPGIS